MALKTDCSYPGGSTSQQSTHTQHRKYRQDHSQTSTKTGRQNALANGALEAMPIYIPPCRQSQKYLSQSKQRQQHANGPCAIALTQCHQGGRHAHPRHTGMQTDVTGDQTSQRCRTQWGHCGHVSQLYIHCNAFKGVRALPCSKKPIRLSAAN